MIEIYTVSEIRDAYCELEKPDPKFLRDIIYHIEKDEVPCRAMSVAADFALMEAIPNIAKHLHHKNRDIRESAAGKLCRLLARGHPSIDMYAAKIYHVAKYDEDISNRALILSFTGYIIDLCSPELQEKFAELIHSYMRPLLGAQLAYEAMINAMGEHTASMDIPPMYPDFVDLEKVQKFRIKYNI